jgi:hypothetical protein
MALRVEATRICRRFVRPPNELRRVRARGAEGSQRLRGGLKLPRCAPKMKSGLLPAYDTGMAPAPLERRPKCNPETQVGPFVQACGVHTEVARHERLLRQLARRHRIAGKRGLSRDKARGAACALERAAPPVLRWRRPTPPHADPSASPPRSLEPLRTPTSWALVAGCHGETVGRRRAAPGRIASQSRLRLPDRYGESIRLAAMPTSCLLTTCSNNHRPSPITCSTYTREGSG